MNIEAFDWAQYVNVEFQNVLCCVLCPMIALCDDTDYDPGFHTCVSRTHNYQRTTRRSMPHDVWTPMITINPSLRNKSLRARHKVAHDELLRGLTRPVPRYAVTVIYRNQQCKKQQRFSVLRKKEQSQKQKNNDDFRKVDIYN